MYDLLDKSIFTPVPIFIDSLGNFILLKWQYLYKGTIRDFYPTATATQKNDKNFQVYVEGAGLSEAEIDNMIREVGIRIHPADFAGLMDIAFLALHGAYGEDGTIQGLLEYYDIPYTGSGILPSAIGIDKNVQKHLLREMNLKVARSETVHFHDWQATTDEAKRQLYQNIQMRFSMPLVIKSARQGSSIGISILKSWNFEAFVAAINKSFFELDFNVASFRLKAETEKIREIQQLIDVNLGLGLPLLVNDSRVNTPEELLSQLDKAAEPDAYGNVRLQAVMGESTVLIEEFIKGREFSCIVIDGPEGKPLALPPTEIIKKSDLFDYRAKYLPGISRKITPIDLPIDLLTRVAESCERLYSLLGFNVYARIDGIIQADGAIYLNDPNTTSGMMPSSFFFHQAAEIGLNPTQFLTFIIESSLNARKRSGISFRQIATQAKDYSGPDNGYSKNLGPRLRVAVILGGYSSERHISVESGRNVYEKLSSSGQYEAVPILLTKDDSGQLRFFHLPVNLLLKDNADDIAEKAGNYSTHSFVTDIRKRSESITRHYGTPGYKFEPEELSIQSLKENFDFAFIALHGRPGEDGMLQAEFEKIGLPYNGSGTESSQTTIDKFRTNEILRSAGIKVADHFLVLKSAYRTEAKELITEIESRIPYPLIAKPSDDGCSSAVKKINDRFQLKLYLKAIFRESEEPEPELRQELGLAPSEEFPSKDYFVVESLIDRDGADHFLEITGGLLTWQDKEGQEIFEVFEPSEALAQGGILTLEEKFLAGEGQNITPARFDPEPEINALISAEVRNTLRRTAEILKVRGYCRIDAFVRVYREAKRVETIIIEINSLPGLTPATCIFHQAALNDYTPFKFLDKIIQSGINHASIKQAN